MNQDHNQNEQRSGRYSSRTRKKGYYILKWFKGLGTKKLVLMGVCACLVLALPVGLGIALKGASKPKEVAVDSVSLKQKQSSDMVGMPGSIFFPTDKSERDKA